MFRGEAWNFFCIISLSDKIIETFFSSFAYAHSSLEFNAYDSVRLTFGYAPKFSFHIL